MSTYAIILGGGSGTRMQGTENKVFLKIKGIPAIIRAIAPFTGFCKGIVVVAQESELEHMKVILTHYGMMRKVCAVVSGGKERQQSVYQGLQALPEDATKVLIHDGARMLITEKVIGDVIKSVESKGSGIASIPVTDTIKRADENGYVLKTIPRDDLFAMQTPQGFRVADIKKAHEQAIKDGFVATDDAAVMEHAGMPVCLCEGDKNNIKLTTKEDIQMAMLVLANKEAEGELS